MNTQEYKGEIQRLSQVNAHYKVHLERFFETIQEQNEILSRIYKVTKDPEVKLILIESLGM